MADKWVLIVDDHRDVRQVLHSGLATLAPELKIVDVPSGEEAMLLVLMQPPDLMVVDINLPGISGLDLLKRARARNPDLKLILITGLVDRKTRQQLLESGAQAYFYKPVPMREFLQTAHNLLQLSPKPQAPQPDPLLSRAAGREPAPPAPPTPAPIAEPVRAVTPLRRLELLLEQAGGRAALLLDGRGQVIQQSGSLLPVDGLAASLIQAAAAAAQVNAMLGKDVVDHLQYFNGKLQSVVLCPIRASRYLVLVLLPGLDGERLAATLGAVHQAARDLAELLPSTAPLPTTPGDATPPDVSSLPSLEDLFGDRLGQLQEKEVDAFWDTALAASPTAGSATDRLSFDEARRLGLGPGAENQPSDA